MSPESVIAWREAMTRLADQYFFDLLRMYLGAIKTPFNKQRLIEELSAFLRKKSTKRRILESLDAEDLLVVAAVREIQSPTQQRIVSLLSPSSSFSSVYERVLNLEERLIIYRKGDEFSRAYAVNPLLEDELAPYANRAALFYPLSRGTSAHAAMRVDDLVLAALYGVFLLEGDSVKNDGTLRKKTMTGILERISRLEGNEALAALLVTALRNLSLLTLVDGGWFPIPRAGRPSPRERRRSGWRTSPRRPPAGTRGSDFSGRRKALSITFRPSSPARATMRPTCGGFRSLFPSASPRRS
jgi:hypothetical protein